jgi:hypothetical protein
MTQTVTPKISVKRVAIALGAVFLGPPALFLMVAVLVLIPIVIRNHADNLHDRLSTKASGDGRAVILPEAPLPSDDAFSTVLTIAGRIPPQDLQEAQYKRNCRGDRYSPRTDRSWCAAFLTRLAAPLEALDAWLTGPSPYKLERPGNLGWHSRFLITERHLTRGDPLPDLRRFEDLGDALAIRAAHRLHRGQAAAAERDLRTLFTLGIFLQQNPVWDSQYVGLDLMTKAIEVIAGHVEPHALGARWEALLPDLTQNLDRLHWTYEVESLSFKDSLDTAPRNLVRHIIGGSVGDSELLAMHPTLAQALGLYSTDRTWREYQAPLRAAVGHIESGRLGGVVFKAPADCASLARDEPRSGGAADRIIAPVREVGRWWEPNIIGRLYFCALEETRHLKREAYEFGLTMDQVDATRVVLAARRFRHAQGRWPAREADLVPRYLGSWPVSALNGQPLRWLPDKSGVKIVENVVPCKAAMIVTCEFSFHPRGLRP